MALTIKATTGALPPLGLYVGTITDIEDMGEEMAPWGKLQHQVKLHIELIDILHSDDEDVAAGYIGDDIHAYANLVFSSGSKLRQWFHSIVREVEDGEDVELDEMIGKPVRFTVALNSAKKPTVSDVAGYKKSSKPKRKRRQAPVEDDEYELEPEEEDDF